MNFKHGKVLLSYPQVTSLVSHFESLSEQLTPSGDKPGLESLLSSVSTRLHPFHSVCVDIKFSLAQLYGRERPESDVIMLRDGERKRELCREVLEVMDKVTPGRYCT